MELGKLLVLAASLTWLALPSNEAKAALNFNLHVSDSTRTHHFVSMAHITGDGISGKVPAVCSYIPGGNAKAINLNLWSGGPLLNDVVLNSNGAGSRDDFFHFALNNGQSPPSECTSVLSGSVDKLLFGSGHYVEVQAGDGDDYVGTTVGYGEFYAFGGAGNDQFVNVASGSDLRGGTGNDRMHNSSGIEPIFYGNSGSDCLSATNYSLDTTLRCGPGNDYEIYGSPDIDCEYYTWSYCT